MLCYYAYKKHTLLQYLKKRHLYDIIIYDIRSYGAIGFKTQNMLACKNNMYHNQIPPHHHNCPKAGSGKLADVSARCLAAEDSADGMRLKICGLLSTTV